MLYYRLQFAIVFAPLSWRIRCLTLPQEFGMDIWSVRTLQIGPIIFRQGAIVAGVVWK
jgi:hypothetical protein